MKRLTLTILCTTLSYLIIFTGCKSTNSKVTNKEVKTGTIEAADAANVNAPGTFPIVKNKINLNVFTPQDPYVEDYNTNEFTKWYEEKTNIHINWDIVPAAGRAEKVQLKLASGDLPDVFLSAGISDAQQVMYGGQGLFIPLNDLIDKYAPNVKNMTKTASYVLDSMVTQDGNIYSLPKLEETYHNSMPKKAWINKPFLDKLGLKMPTTTEEFYQALKAFKTLGPDIVPMAGADGDKNNSNEIESFLMQSFTFYDRGLYMMMNKDKVEFVANTPEYKEGLKYIKKLISEGLIASESFTQDRKAMTALAENPAGNRLGVATGLTYGHFTIDMGESGRYKDYVTIPVLAGPNGKRYGYDRGYAPVSGAFLITKNCKNPAAAMRWIDVIYDYSKDLELEYHPYFGKAGRDWLKADSSAKGIDGRQAVFAPQMAYGIKQNVHWNQTAPAFQTHDFRMSSEANAAAALEVRLYEATKNNYKPYATPEKKVPFMFFSEEQLNKSGDLKTNVNQVVQTFLVKFVTGNLDIDKDWNTYLKELDNAGLPEYMKLTQEVYDANQKAKKNN